MLRDTKLIDDEIDDGVNYYEQSSRKEPARKYMRAPIIAGEVFILVGLLVIMFVFYQLVFTNIVTARDQANEVASIRNTWSQERSDGEGSSIATGTMGIITSSKLGGEYPLFKGTDQETLAKGPGVYTSSARFGSKGNVGIAAHRDGWNAPFSNVDTLNTCDDLRIEDRSSIYTYTVISRAGDSGARTEQNKSCLGDDLARSLDSDQYKDLSGQSIVDPSQGRVVWQVPGKSDSPDDASLALLTLTSCHPHWSNGQRIIVHAVLTEVKAKYTG